MSGAARLAGTILLWSLLLVLIPLGPVLGSAASILASVLAIALLPLALGQGGWRLVLEARALRIFLAVFVALAFCFALTMREPRDLLFAFNFIALPLAAGVYVAARHASAGAGTVATLAILCLAAALAALLVAVNDIFWLGRPLVYGFNLGPHVVARVGLLLGFLSLAGLFVTPSRWRLLFYLGPLAALAVTYLSGTRGAALAVPALTLVYAAFLFAERRERTHFWVLAAASVAVLVALGLASDRLASVPRILADLIAGTPTSDGSTNDRFAMLGAAWALYLQSPFVGHGWAHFAALAHPLIGASVWGGPADPFFQFHNDLANFAVAAGTTGILCYPALLAAPLLGALQGPRDALFRVRLYATTQLGVAVLVFGATDMTLGYDLPTTLYAFLTALVLGGFREPAAPAARGSTG